MVQFMRPQPAANDGRNPQSSLRRACQKPKITSSRIVIIFIAFHIVCAKYLIHQQSHTQCFAACRFAGMSKPQPIKYEQNLPSEAPLAALHGGICAVGAARRQRSRLSHYHPG
jgi:hypothetical protein